MLAIQSVMKDQLMLRDHEVGLISPMYTVFQIDASEVDGEFLFRGLKRLALRGRV